MPFYFFSCPAWHLRMSLVIMKVCIPPHGRRISFSPLIPLWYLTTHLPIGSLTIGPAGYTEKILRFIFILFFLHPCVTHHKHSYQTRLITFTGKPMLAWLVLDVTESLGSGKQGMEGVISDRSLSVSTNYYPRVFASIFGRRRALEKLELLQLQRDDCDSYKCWEKTSIRRTTTKFTARRQRAKFASCVIVLSFIAWCCWIGAKSQVTGPKN